MHFAAGLFSSLLGLLYVYLICFTFNVRAIGRESHAFTLTTGTFPWLATLGLLICGVILIYLVRSNNLKEQSVDFSLQTLKIITLVVAALSVYIYLLGVLGYVIPTGIFAALISFYFGVRHPVKFLCFGFGLSIAIYYVFGKLLLVPLP